MPGTQTDTLECQHLALTEACGVLDRSANLPESFTGFDVHTAYSNALAHRIATVPPDLLAVNKAICEKALDAMGRQLMQSLAIEADAIAHKTPVMKKFYEIGKTEGFKAALEAINRPYTNQQ